MKSTPASSPHKVLSAKAPPNKASTATHIKSSPFVGKGKVHAQGPLPSPRKIPGSALPLSNGNQIKRPNNFLYCIDISENLNFKFKFKLGNPSSNSSCSPKKKKVQVQVQIKNKPKFKFTFFRKSQVQSQIHQVQVQIQVQFELPHP